jgi:ubiquinone/menaquinone biosynthesis C-methylase UbiE
MFLSRRSMQAEYFDSERPAHELEAFYRCLNSVNRLFAFDHLFQFWVPKLLSTSGCQSLSLLDLGAGDGALGQALGRWAAQRGWYWKVTNLDLSTAALRLSRTGWNVAGSALALPFLNDSFDVVIASQMAHHLGDSETEQMLRESWRVARRAVVISDLHRNPLLYFTLALLCSLRRFPPEFRADALLSVKKSWRAPELERLAGRAGLTQPEVRVYFAARVLLVSSKQARSEARCPLHTRC